MRINWKALDEPKMGDAIGVGIVLLAAVVVALVNRAFDEPEPERVELACDFERCVGK